MKRILLCAFAFIMIICTSVNAQEVRLGIMSFASKVPNVSSAMTAPISDYFFKTLFKAGGIRLIERERLDMIGQEIRTGMSGLVDSGTAARVGKIAGCNYMLVGALTNLQRSTKGSSFGKLFSNKREKVRAVLDVRIVQVDTGDIIFAEDAAAETEKEEESYNIAGIGKTESGFDGLEMTAISKAVEKITPSIMKALRGDDTSGYYGNAVSSFVQSNPAPVTVAAPTPAVAPVSTPAPVSVPATAVTQTRQNPQAKAPALSGIASSRKNAKFENRSTDPAKVIKSYGLPEDYTQALIEKHKNALKLKSRETRSETYAAMFEENEGDYLAAYYAGLAEFDMSHGGKSIDWCEKSLNVNPRYYPAKELKKRAEGLVKQ